MSLHCGTGRRPGAQSAALPRVCAGKVVKQVKIPWVPPG